MAGNSLGPEPTRGPLGAPRRRTGEAGRGKGRAKKEWTGTEGWGGRTPERSRDPGRPREAQRGPERPRGAQRGPERPRESQRGQEKRRKAQRGPEKPREAQRGPERRSRVPDRRRPDLLKTLLKLIHKMNTFWDFGFSQKIGTAQTESQERPREAVAAGLPAGYGGIRGRN